MKAKNNLDLFRNEIIYELTKGCYIYDVMMKIYLRESGNGTRCVEHMLKWFADVPRETLEVSKEMYDYLFAYTESELVADDSTLDFYIATSILIDIGVIPKKYSKYKLKEFIEIIRVKESKK